MTHVLIDADIVSYRCAAANENEEEHIARWQANQMIERIVHETGATAVSCFLTGSDNFRLLYNPEYKANRKDMPRPKHLQAVREELCLKHQAMVCDGEEADDRMGIIQCRDEEPTIIATIDKDLLMIPGKHYNFVKQEFQEVSPLQGIQHFYYQLIMGDRTDNIFGFDGKARHKVPKFLEPAVAFLLHCTEEQEMYEHVRDMYNDDERLLMNGRCLWIRRNEGEVWNVPGETMDGGSSQSFYN